jgi:hypothetical protein
MDAKYDFTGSTRPSELRIASYPRSGSNFFSYEFEAKTGIRLPLDHSMYYRDNIFSCIRNPIESLASGVAMGLETNKQKTIASVGQHYYDTQGDLFNDNAISLGLDYNIHQYEVFYSYLDKSKNAIVDYETYSSNIDSSIATAASFFDIELLPNPGPANPGKDNPLNGYLVSSKGSEFYERALEIVSKKDLTQATALYEKCLQKSILLRGTGRAAL